MSYIRVQNLFKSYDSHEILRDISFNVQKGEVISILGPSGCGKTTLLRCLLGLQGYESGKISLNGESQASWLKKNRVAYVPQKYANFEHLTVAGNIMLSLKKSGINNKKERLHQLLKDVNLTKFKNDFPLKLSGGMQQRLALARALAQDTSIIAFDESLNALDIDTRQRLQDLILELSLEHKKTVLFVTHDIEEAIFLSNRIVVLGTRPGTVREIINVPFGYPRRSNIRFSEEFQRLRKVLSFIIRSETIKSSLTGEAPEFPTVKVGLYYWPGNAPFFYAQDKELFGQLSLPLQLISFSDNRQKIEYWKNGQIDILNVTVDTAMRLLKEIPDAEIIAGLNISQGGDALVSRGKIKSISQIKGKKIALEKGEISDFFLKYILYKNGLKPNEVVIRDLRGDEIGTALINNQVDAAVLWEPWLTRTVELANANILATSLDYPVFADVLIARKKFINENKNQIVILKKVWRQAVNQYSSDPKGFIRSVAPLVGLSDQELDQQLKKIKFFDGSLNEVNEIQSQIKEAVN